jgi:hypothetical protein
MWSFLITNKSTLSPLTEFQVATSLIERFAGIKLWSTLVGVVIEKEKNNAKRAMW